MNKDHRDRIAFMRICSGKFTAGMEAIPCTGWKEDKTFTATADDGSRKEKSLTEAYAGDIIGVFDPGIFSIGDTTHAQLTR